MTESPDPQPLPFTPVPGRARHDGWTPERQRRFVEALAATGTVTAAARAAGMSARSAYTLRRRAGKDSDLARAWDRALDAGLSDAMDVGIRCALEGERVPVFYGGRQVGEYRRYDTSLALAVLRASAARAERRAPPGTAPNPFATADRAERFHSALKSFASTQSPAKPREHRELPLEPSFRNDTAAKP